MATEKIISGPQPLRKVGRGYYIDGLDIADSIMDREYAVVKNLSPADIARGVDQNIYGISDYGLGQFKVEPSPEIAFSEISAFLKQGELHPRYNKCLGIFYFNESPTGFDLVNGSAGEIIIPRETPVIQLCLPRVDFSGNRDKVVTPSMISESLGLVAEYIRDRSLDFVIGLTHPRMGRIAARRWGFALEEQPFPPEVYQLLDRGIEDVIKEKDTTPPSVIQSLEAFRSQVLVYQTKADFINNPWFH